MPRSVSVNAQRRSLTDMAAKKTAWSVACSSINVNNVLGKYNKYQSTWLSCSALGPLVLEAAGAEKAVPLEEAALEKAAARRWLRDTRRKQELSPVAQ